MYTRAYKRAVFDFGFYFSRFFLGSFSLLFSFFGRRRTDAAELRPPRHDRNNGGVGRAGRLAAAARIVICEISCRRADRGSACAKKKYRIRARVLYAYAKRVTIVKIIIIIMRMKANNILYDPAAESVHPDRGRC